MMRVAILGFVKQLTYEPIIENVDALPAKDAYLLTGMGGSHLAANLVFAMRPSFPLVVRRDYGLPEVSKELLHRSLFIASSYSGNTEEVLEAYAQAKEKGLDMAAIAVGGKLIELAKADGIPYIQMPSTGIQPRSALGFSFLAHLKLLGLDSLLKETQALASMIDPAALEPIGASLAAELQDRIPIMYTSQRNETIAWNWKIKCNENSKIPSFYHVIPELNHHEMNGFDVVDSTKHLSERFSFILITDDEDHPQNRKRMDVLKQLYIARGLPVHMMQLEGNSRLEKIFRSLIIADWMTIHLADFYGVESEKVPMVEEFKRMIG